MKSVAVAISVGVFAVSLSLPGVLFAQDSDSEEPQAEQQTAEPDSPEASADEAATESEPARRSGPKPEASGANSKQGDDFATKASANVSMIDNDFQPATVTVNAGDSVTWQNDGQLDHTATGSNFSTGTVSPGDSASETFSTPGSYSYVCDFHPDMKGTVEVEASGAPSPGGDSGGTDPGTDTAPTTPTTPMDTTPTTSSAPTTTSSSLPATGQDELPLTIVGLALLGVGAFTLSLARWLELWDGP